MRSLRIISRVILIGVVEEEESGGGGRYRVTSRESSQPSEVLAGPRRTTQAHSYSPCCRLTLIWGLRFQVGTRSWANIPTSWFDVPSCIGGHAFRMRAHSASLTCLAIRGQWGVFHPHISIVGCSGVRNTLYNNYMCADTRHSAEIGSGAVLKTFVYSIPGKMIAKNSTIELFI